MAPDRVAARQRYCETRSCRGPIHVELEREDGEPFVLDVPIGPPVVQEGVVTVLSGEIIFVEARAAPTRLVGVRQVPRPLHPERTLMLALWQQESGEGGFEMVFEVRNPFEQPLKYLLAMQLPDGDELVATPGCRVPARSRGVQVWPHPIFQLVVSGFFLLDPKDHYTKVCPTRR